MSKPVEQDRINGALAVVPLPRPARVHQPCPNDHVNRSIGTVDRPRLPKMGDLRYIEMPAPVVSGLDGATADGRSHALPRQVLRVPRSGH
jgi:hypothetical protein